MIIEYIKFVSAALLNVLLVIGVYFLDKRTRFRELKRIYKELIIGVLFGCSAIYASVFGVKIWGATMNVRDASPISAVSAAAARGMVPTMSAKPAAEFCMRIFSTVI